VGIFATLRFAKIPTTQTLCLKNMKWNDYLQEFRKHTKMCISFAKQYTDDIGFPEDILCSLEFEDSRNERGADEKIKYIGGRHLTRTQLEDLSVERAAKLTFADGKVPRWVNLYVTGKSKTNTYITVVPSKDLVDDSESTMNFPSGTKHFQIGLGANYAKT